MNDFNWDRFNGLSALLSFVLVLATGCKVEHVGRVGLGLEERACQPIAVCDLKLL